MNLRAPGCRAGSQSCHRQDFLIFLSQEKASYPQGCRARGHVLLQRAESTLRNLWGSKSALPTAALLLLLLPKDGQGFLVLPRRRVPLAAQESHTGGSRSNVIWQRPGLPENPKWQHPKGQSVPLPLTVPLPCTALFWDYGITENPMLGKDPQ